MRGKPLLALVVMFLALLSALATPISKADPAPTATTTDFDAMGSWTDFVHMDPLFFKSAGIRFESDYVVGWSNGHAALVANEVWTTPPFTIAATFTRPVTSVSVSFRMGMQGTSDYTLVAYSPSGDVIGSDTISLTNNGLDGNFYDVTVSNLPSKAKSFSIVGAIEYDVKSITYEY